MRIGIDAHCIGAQKTGNETYTYELVRNLARLPVSGHQFFVYLTGRGTRSLPAVNNSHFSCRLIRPASAPLRISFGFGYETRRRKLDVFHAQYFLPAGLGCKSVLMVHDISYERHPEFFTRKHNLICRTLIPDSCRRADWILTVSEHSKRDLIELYGLNPERITVTYNGCPDECRPVDSALARETVRRYGIQSEYLLYVGTLQPRKNLPRLLRAFSQLKVAEKIPHKLVIVGKREWLFEEIFATIREHRLEADVVLTGYVPWKDLPGLYSAATAFVYPSIYEGFGMPVIEAMSCGTPVITSRGSSLEEIAAGAAYLVDPLDVTELAHAIEKVATDSKLRSELKAQGLQRSAQFSYTKMAEKTMQVFERVCSS